jgi:hypothetical protein
MSLLPVHRKFLVINQGIVSTVFNFFLNGAIAWFLYHSVKQVPLWGAFSVGADTLTTSIVIPSLTCLTVALSVTFTITRGWMPALENFPKSGISGRFLRQSVLTQALIHGCAGVILFGIPATAWFVYFGNDGLSFEAFLRFKAIYAAALSLIFSPVIGFFALYGSEPRRCRVL